jgi:hypothetical protein
LQPASIYTRPWRSWDWRADINWILSVSEDGFVIALGVLALKYPLAAAVIVIAAVMVIVASASWRWRKIRRS